MNVEMKRTCCVLTNKVWFQLGVGILLAMLIILLFSEIRGIFSPIVIIVRTIALPLLLGGVLFYLFLPLLRVLENRAHFKRWQSILSIFVVLILAIWGFSALVGPMVAKQFNEFVDNAPKMMKDVEKVSKDLWNNRDLLPETIQESIEAGKKRISSFVIGFGTGIIGFVSSLFQGLFMLILVPFFLVYMLKDHEKFAPFVSNIFSGEKREWVRKTLSDIDTTLRAYIQGQVLVSAIVGMLLLIGYLIIGLDYALLLAIFGMFMNVIPFLGPYISVIPALIIAFLQDPILVIWVAIIMLVAQQIESNFISPNVMGKALDVHPLTVITVILAAGNIAGILGIILAMPTYAVGKVIVKNVYSRRKEIRKAATKEV